jgi:hypothetical protein
MLYYLRNYVASERHISGVISCYITCEQFEDSVFFTTSLSTSRSSDNMLSTLYMKFLLVFRSKNFLKFYLPCRIQGHAATTYLLTPWSTVLLKKLTGFAASQ